MRNKNIDYLDVNVDNCTFVAMSGDKYGRCTMIADNDTKRIFFSYGGVIMCELMESGRLKWNVGVSDRVKRLIRLNWNDIKTGRAKIVTAKTVLDA